MVRKSRQKRAPDQADFDRAIAARADRWYAACLRITRDPQLAEDALQDALLRAWRKRRQFQHGARLETWIHRIAVNSALELLRKQRPQAFGAMDNEIADPSGSVEQAEFDRQLNAQLGAAIEHLTDFERACFVLKHLEQWQLKEIAAEVDKSVGAVKQALFRAVHKLRGRMPALAR
jgi:RNA polymerase sigma-70 factor (ECF subfamily)